MLAPNEIREITEFMTRIVPRGQDEAHRLAHLITRLEREGNINGTSRSTTASTRK